MQAILRQLDFELTRFGATAGSIETLFIGGGTPSTVAPRLYAPFFEKLSHYLAEDAEITTEANPNSATPAWLEGMRDLGVNRVSFGVQSFDAGKLRMLGRNHTPQMAHDAIVHAAEAGFAHISLDLIYGTAMDDAPLLLRDLDLACALPIDHLSAYSLTIEEGTKFFETPEVSRDEVSLAYRFTEAIAERGFAQYEISNFARPCRCRHNLGYWRYRDYIGIGSGAVGFLRDRRYYPTASVEAYIASPLSRTEERLDAEAIKSEKILLGLRSEVGISYELLDEAESVRAGHLIEAGKLTMRAGRLYNANYFLSDEIALYLLD